jgi:phosphate acetyltransferase
MQLGQFEGKLGDLAKTSQYSITLPESRDPRIAAAAAYLLQSGSVRQIYFFLRENELVDFCRRAGLGYDKVRPRVVLVPEQISDIVDKTYDHIISHPRNKNKKWPKNEVLTFAQNSLYQAGYLAASGHSQVTLAGATATTAEVLKAGLATIPLQEGIRSISSSFLMVRETAEREELMLFADCGVIVEPDSTQLADIASASCHTWEKLMGNEHPPVLAFLSFATKGSAEHASLDVLREGLRLFREARPGVLCDGELQFDAAFDREVGLRKSPGSGVPGKANVYIFPNLAAGNLSYKIAQRLGGFSAYGPLLQGFSTAYSDLSRGCTSKDIVMSVYINMLLARS